MGGNTESKEAELAMLWVLNFSDGDHTLLDIAEKAGLAFESVAEAAGHLCAHGLLKGGGDPESGAGHARSPRLGLV
jgi:aminopeptidase-like protein